MSATASALEVKCDTTFLRPEPVVLPAPPPELAMMATAAATITTETTPPSVQIRLRRCCWLRSCA
jgi:hypothetical protein